MATVPDSQASADRDWFIVGRWQEFEGEGRANLLRLIGIAAFYAVELVNYYGVNLGFLQMPQTVERPFHLAVTFLTLAWAMLCVGVLLCRKQRIFPTWLKYLSTGGDIVLLTSILTLADGPRSPLVAAYPLIIVLASLRFNLPLIWFASGGAIAGYLWLLGYARWGELPPWSERDNLLVPRYAQVIFVLALVLTGVVLGQVIRRMRGIAEDYARRVEEAREAKA
jgi:hypothetical protein